MRAELGREAKVVLITGLSGFLARYICQNYKSHGWDVHGVIRKITNPKSITFIPSNNIHEMGDDYAFINDILEKVKPDIVIHLASLFISEHNPQQIDALIESNILFGTKLLEAMRQSNVKKIINVGTAWQNYNGSCYRPVNLYAATKQAFADILEYYVDAEGFSAVTLKLTDTYGSNDPRNKIVNLLCMSAREKKTLEMSPGEQLIDLIHADDVANCFGIVGHDLLSNDKPGHAQFYVGSGEMISLKSLINILGEILGTSIPVIWGARDYRRREVMIPFLGLRYPGWEPLIKIHEGLRIVLENAYD